ncbi:MAG: plasmid pRiA4b ORF-3 family protein [Flavobacteriales bacterium]|nr:plasmid pRiA4b ORF-3 family protein [Flavobacteriales bacterium]
MSSIIKIRVLIDYEDDVFRDIELSSESSFKDLHNIIQEAYSFDKGHMASFYLSNDNWDKGQEIPLMKMDFDDGSSSLEMDQVLLKDKVETIGQKLIYVFDFLLMWCFFVEIISINDASEEIEPRITTSYGESPNQYSKEIPIDPADDQYLLKNKGKADKMNDPFEGIEGLEESDDEFLI